MVEKELKCASCSKKITNDPGSTSFKCPNCGKYQIVRCFHCREIGARWKCPNCNFSGPN